MESRSSGRLRTRASAAYLHYGSEFPLARLRLGLAAIQGPGALQPVLWGIPGSILGLPIGLSLLETAVSR